MAARFPVYLKEMILPYTLLTLGLLGLSVLALSTCLFLLLCILLSIRISRTPKGVPWVGLKNRRVLPKLRACLGEWSAGRSATEEGYEKYGRHGEPFILPGMTWCPVVLPPSNTVWIARQPDHILDGNKTLDDTLGLGILAHEPSPESARDFSVLQRDLTRQLLYVNDSIHDEIRTAFDEHLGFEGEWRDVKLQEVLHTVAFRTSNRIFVGLPFCRDAGYRRAVDRWALAFGLTGLALRSVVPGPVKRFVMGVLALPTRYCEGRAAAFLEPEILRRVEMGCRADGLEKENEVRNDMIQWLISASRRKSGTEKVDPSIIAGKCILFNLFAEHTTAMAAGSIVFNLLPLANVNELLSELREEARTVLPQLEENPRQIREMKKFDSLIRETLNSHPTGIQFLRREVVQPGGITTPDGLHLPQGTHTHSLIYPPQQHPPLSDEDASEYRPLRSYRADDQHQNSAVHIREDYLSFGLGKHSCPGRFAAVHILKLMLGYLFLHYDLAPMQEGDAKFDEFADFLMPSEKNVVRLRRRKVDGV